VYFQAFDKVTFAPVWSARRNAALEAERHDGCGSIVGDGIVLFISSRSDG
jgi:hypothetical protein